MRRARTAMAATLLGLLGLAILAAAGAADDDHEAARAALQRGETMPLSRLLALVEAEFDGRLVEVELEREDGRLVYEVEILTPAGRLIELTYDARTGALLEAEGAGVEAARRRR